jgi:hypothetical protein
MATSKNVTVFWDAVQCSQAEIFQRLGGAYRIYHHGKDNHLRIIRKIKCKRMRWSRHMKGMKNTHIHNSISSTTHLWRRRGRGCIAPTHSRPQHQMEVR